MNEPPTHEVRLTRDAFTLAAAYATKGGVLLPASCFKTQPRVQDRVRVREIGDADKPTGMEFTGKVINAEWNEAVSVWPLKEGE